MSAPLIQATDTEVTRLHETLATLITWLRRELGDAAMMGNYCTNLKAEMRKTSAARRAAMYHQESFELDRHSLIGKWHKQLAADLLREDRERKAFRNFLERALPFLRGHVQARKGFVQIVEKRLTRRSRKSIKRHQNRLDLESELAAYD